MKLAELLEPGAVAAMVMEYVPDLAVEAAASVSVDDVAELVGAKEAVTPAGRPDAAKVTADEKPFAGFTVITSVALDPCGTVMLVEAGDKLKVAPAVMTNDKLAVAFVAPEVPVNVSG